MSQIPPYQPPLPYATPALEFQKRSTWSWLKWVVIALVVLLMMGSCLFLFAYRPPNGSPQIPLSEFRRVLLANGVANVSIDGDSLSGTFKVSTPIMEAAGPVSVTRFETQLPSGTCNWQFVQWLLENAGTARVDVSVSNNFLMQMVVPLIPWILIFGFVVFFLRRSGKTSAALRQQPMRVIILNPEAKQ